MPHLIVVCLSPAVDRTYKVTQMIPGQMHRCASPVISAGGKGVNVSRVLSMLGADVSLTGFFAGNCGNFIVEDMNKYNVKVDPVWLAGETRSSINIIETSNHTETELLEEGPVASPVDFEAITAKLERLFKNAGPSSCVVFAGGITRGLPTDTYGRLISLAARYGLRSFLDSSSMALKHGIEAVPFFIKPNLREFADITGYRGVHTDILTGTDLDMISISAHKLRLPIVAVTMAGLGSVVITDDSLLYARPPETLTVNSIGSGDSFTAGFALAIACGGSTFDALSLAMAAAASNVSLESVGMIDPVQVSNFKSSVIIENR